VSRRFTILRADAAASALRILDLLGIAAVR